MQITATKQSSITKAVTNAVTKVQRISHNGNDAKAEFDQVISEEPLQISLSWLDQGQEHHQVFTITMRTPGDDTELTLGLLLSEGLITQVNQLAHISNDQDTSQDQDRDQDTPLPNQLTVQFKPGFSPDLATLQRNLITQSSCGICGKTSLKSLEFKAPKPLDSTPGWLDIEQVKTLPTRLRQQQTLFEQTGGVHGAAIFNQDYQILSLKEDVGRHNAVDKVIGDQLLQHVQASATNILLVSGRVSFELVQKAVVAGYPVLVAVGAPSSLAVSAAQRFDLTLIGFTSSNRFNVYHGQWRLKKSTSSKQPSKQ